VNDKTLQKICAELASVLSGQKFGKIFQLTRFQSAIDFRLSDSRYLFVSIEPTSPRIYLIKRRLRDLEKQSKNPNAFLQLLRKKLSNAFLEKVEKIADERIVRFDLSAHDEIGQAENYALIAQLTGRSANLFLLDKNDFILDAARENTGEGQEIGNRYAPPFREEDKRRKGDEEIFAQGDFASLSESLDNFYLEKEAEKAFQAKVQSARSKLKQEISKREKLIKKLKQDLENHGDAAKWKRAGDLLLANLANAEREGNTVLVTDFFDENVPLVEIEVEENLSLTEAAEKFFKRYTKARNALEEISKRLAISEVEIEDLQAQSTILEEAIEAKDEDVLAEFTGEKPISARTKSKKTQAENFTGARRYTSSEGFEILVGKGSKDNDFLTFRVAKSSDLWLHAADYPGSHVVVKNPNRKEIPPKTLLEAAQIAAFFSKAKEQPKVAVHYTQKKFVNKPKGASLGLVSLASFKTILVEPKINEK
jgi:predicted ribosome quality control (RQC) complex YloA/Tae2 family protein